MSDKPYDLAFVTASARYGDFLSLLPLIYHEAQQGKKCALVGPKELAPWFHGIGYCDFITNPTNLPMYKTTSKENRIGDATFKEVIAAPDPLPAPTTDSWQKDQWKWLNRLHLWKENLPLVFDKWSNSQSDGHSLPLVLIAPNGRSSPFPYMALLEKLVSALGQFNYSFLEDKLSPSRVLIWMRQAHCLITPDTMHLHLARACPDLPVFALVNDAVDSRGMLWQKSAWQPNHVFHCLYSDWPKRALEMLDLIPNAKTGLEQRAKNLYVQVTSSLDPQDEKVTRLPAHIEIHPGTFGRSAKHGSVKDPLAYPYFKDCIRAAVLGMSVNQYVVVSRGATHLGLPRPDESGDAFFSRRVIRRGDTEEAHPAYDLFAFTKEFWQAHGGDLADVLWSDEYGWTQLVAAWMRKHGAKEVNGVCWREGR